MTHSQWLPVIYIFCMLKDVATSTKENWSINIKQHAFTVETSGNITINCTVQFPRPKTSNNIQGFWKEGSKTCRDRQSKDFIFHPNSTLVMERFRGRTKALGNVTDNNCSLSISNIQSNHVGQYYFRVETGSNNYSFCQNMVIITIKGKEHVSEVTQKDVTEIPLETTSVSGNLAPSTDISIFIYVPIILLAVVIVAVTVFLLRRRKRRRHPVRQDSSYYVNFRPPCELQQDGPKLTEKFEKELEPPPFTPTPKSEPVYGNVDLQQGKTLEEPVAASDQMENIYSNVGSGVQW